MQERYSKIMEDWFLMEPALFQVLCTHELSINAMMECPLRSGRKRLEYNPDLVSEMTDAALEEAMRAEAVRILMKHPYERRPEGCSQKAMGLASNIVIGDNYPHHKLHMPTPQEMGLKNGMSYEWYANEVEEKFGSDGNGNDGGSGSSGGNGADGEYGNNGGEGVIPSEYSDLAGLWEEDELMVQAINGIIASTKEWGSLSGSLAERLKATLKAKINWRHILSGFRASILSSKRKLTRMRPNRRTGFEHMGSTQQFHSRLLIAVDVSGSITTKSLMRFYGVVNSAFKYGFKSVDVIQFDCGISTVHTLRSVIRQPSILGRGGTSFQEPIDFAHKENYDGLIILTDGYAPAPVIPSGFKTSLLWVCLDEECYEQHKHWMSRSGRVCTMQIQ